MGRPGLGQHRKFLRLGHLLKSNALARGHLELMWEAAYQSGNELIGDSLEVELTCQWAGEPGVLASAMVTCGFLDELPVGDRKQYVIHDLWDHAPQYVARRAVREAHRIASGKTLREVKSEAGKKGGIISGYKRTKQKEAGESHVLPHSEAKVLTPSPSPSPSPADADQPKEAGLEPPFRLQEAWNRMAAEVGLGQWKSMRMGSMRWKKAYARWNENPDMGFWEKIIERIGESNFCLGKAGGRGWRADADFLLRPETAVRVMEGKYDNRGRRDSDDEFTTYKPLGGDDAD